MKSLQTNYEWVSIHIYQIKEHNIFLTQVIEPLVFDLLKLKKIIQYFFIRYSDELGRHIRLRLLINNNHLEIKSLLSSHFGGQLSFFEIPNRSNFVNNLEYLRYSIYEPETDRYGGIAGIGVAEKYFFYSSNAAFNILIELTAKSNYSILLGKAMLLHIVSAKSFDLSIKDLILFFKILSIKWLPYTGFTIKNESENLSRELFESNFASQKENIINLIKNIFESDEFLTNSKTLEWFQNSIEVKNDFIALLNTNNLDIPNTEYFKEISNSNKIYSLWPIYSSCFHMTNNRLGILNQDESLLYYLIYRGLEEIDLNENSHTS